MTKIQVQLPSPLYRRMKEIARTLDYPMAELLRRGVEHVVVSYEHILVEGQADRPPAPLDLGLKIESPRKLRELAHQGE